MKSDEIIKRLMIEPYSVVLATAVGWKPIDYYPKSDVDRIVAEVSAGYEAQNKVLREALRHYGMHNMSCIWNDDTEKDGATNCDCGLTEALSQSSPLAALEEVRKAAKIEGKIEALEEAASWFTDNDDNWWVIEELRRMANEMKG